MMPWGQGPYRGLGHKFWTEDCRGPALPHTHGFHAGDVINVHINCPCKDCGLTPARWEEMVHYNEGAKIVDPDGQPLALEQKQIPPPPFMERKAVTGEYGEAPERDWAQQGQGVLTPEWKHWAMHALVSVDSEYR